MLERAEIATVEQSSFPRSNYDMNSLCASIPSLFNINDGQKYCNLFDNEIYEDVSVVQRMIVMSFW